MYCKNCGKFIENKSLFCGHCGKEVAKKPIDNDMYVCSKCKMKCHPHAKTCERCGGVVTKITAEKSPIVFNHKLPPPTMPLHIDEKIVIQNEEYNTKHMLRTLFIIMSLFFALFITITIMDIEMMQDNSSYRQSDRTETISFDLFVSFFPYAIYIIVKIIATFVAQFSISVTNKRIYGQVLFGKQVDLDLESISSVSTGAFKGIIVGTPSGKIRFRFVKNQYKVHQVISNILIEKSKIKQTQSTLNRESQNTYISIADELMKYNNLLNNGIITQEEFDIQKNKLLR